MKKKSLTNYAAFLTASVFSLTYFFLVPFTQLSITRAQEPAEKKVSKLYIPTGASSTYMKTSEGEEHLLIQDHITSTRIVESQRGDEQQNYYPYGMTSGEANEVTDKQFTSHRSLEDTGVYHAAARFYSPQLAAFIQADKVEGSNRYSYVKNNPLSNTDPTGNITCRRCGDMPNLLSMFGDPDKFPDNPSPINNIKSFFKANAANFLSAVGVLGFLPESSLDQYVSKQQIRTDFMLATAPGAAMISAPRVQLPRFSFSNRTGARLNRSYDSVMSEAEALFRTSPSIDLARRGAIGLDRGDTSFDTYNAFIRSMNKEGIVTAWDAPGAFAPNRGFHTNEGNLIRTLDDGTQRTLVMHPRIRDMLNTNPRAGLDEAYFHGVHDFSAVKLGFHSPTHPHRGLASGFHYLDYLFNRSVGRSGQSQLHRFNQTRAGEFNIPYGTNP